MLCLERAELCNSAGHLRNKLSIRINWITKCINIKFIIIKNTFNISSTNPCMEKLTLHFLRYQYNFVYRKYLRSFMQQNYNHRCFYQYKKRDIIFIAIFTPCFKYIIYLFLIQAQQHIQILKYIIYNFFYRIFSKYLLLDEVNK